MGYAILTAAVRVGGPVGNQVFSRILGIATQTDEKIEAEPTRKPMSD